VTNVIKQWIGLFAVVIMAAGCSTTTKSIDSETELAKALVSPDSAVVFGKFRLVRNGDTVKLGNGIFANSATLRLIQDGVGDTIVGQVGRNGEFAWVLQPGEYRVSNIGFKTRGDTFEPEADFSFTVAPGNDAVYVGTVTLESTMNYGYYALNGTIDSYSVDNDCAADCATRLQKLGLDSDEVVVALLQQEGRLAGVK